MRIKYILSTCVLAALIFSSCEHDLNHNMVDDKIGFSYSSNLQQPSVLNESMDIAVIKSGKGSSSATVRIEKLTEEELNAWCKNNGAMIEVEDNETGEKTEKPLYLLADDSRYEISTEELSFSASDIRKSFTAKWNAPFFANSAMNDKNYVIGFKLVDSSLELGENRDTLIIHPRLSKVSFKTSDLKSLYPTKDFYGREPAEFDAEVDLDYAVKSMDIEVELKIDNSKIAEEAAKRKKEFEVAPDGLFKFKDTKVVFKAGETVTRVKYSIDYSVLFDKEGNLINDNINYLIPISFGKKTPELIGDGKTTTGFIALTVSTKPIVEPQPRPVELIHGPWEVLEGADMHIGNDPKCPSPAWYGHYNVTKLVDWNFTHNNNNDASKNGFWGSYYWSPVPFPMVFVFDTGGDYIFEYFYKVDSSGGQGQYQDFEVYTATEYAGKDTNWEPLASGNTGFRGWQDYNKTMEGSTQNIDTVLEMFSYKIPALKNEDDGEILTRGRYIKFVITKCAHGSEKDQDRGYLMEIYAEGWNMK